MKLRYLGKVSLMVLLVALFWDTSVSAQHLSNVLHNHNPELFQHCKIEGRDFQVVDSLLVAAYAPFKDSLYVNPREVREFMKLRLDAISSAEVRDDLSYFISRDSWLEMAWSYYDIQENGRSRIENEIRIYYNINGLGSLSDSGQLILLHQFNNYSDKILFYMPTSSPIRLEEKVTKIFSGFNVQDSILFKTFWDEQIDHYLGVQKSKDSLCIAAIETYNLLEKELDTAHMMIISKLGDELVQQLSAAEKDDVREFQELYFNYVDRVEENYFKHLDEGKYDYMPNFKAMKKRYFQMYRKFPGSLFYTLRNRKYKYEGAVINLNDDIKRPIAAINEALTEWNSTFVRVLNSFSFYPSIENEVPFMLTVILYLDLD